MGEGIKIVIANECEAIQNSELTLVNSELKTNSPLPQVGEGIKIVIANVVKQSKKTVIYLDCFVVLLLAMTMRK